MRRGVSSGRDATRGGAASVSDRRHTERAKLAALARTTSSDARQPRHARAEAVTVGVLRRLDSGASPDRHPAAVRWPDERRPHPRRVESAATPPSEALGRRFQTRPGEAGGAVPGSPALASEVEGPRGSGGAARRDGVEANARLTGSTAAVLLVLLAVEGLTILRMGPLLDLHVFVGILLIPLVLVKIGSTTWRFARYYLGDPAYRRKGPPLTALRLLGPIVVVLTAVVLASGVALLFASPAWRTRLLLLHKVSFVLWLVVMTVHVLGHLLDTAKLAPRDWYWRTRRQITGAGARQWLLASAVVLGLVGGAAMLPHVATWLSGAHPAVSGPHHR